MKKNLTKVFLVLILYSLSSGIFLNFQELWLQDNSLSISTIGTITTAGLLMSVVMIFVFSSYISNDKLKKFITILMSSKFIIQIILFFLNKSSEFFFIKLFVMIAFIIDVEIITSMYPLITQFKKSDKVYALKDLIYESSYNIGIVITSLLIGKSIFSLTINYNTYIILSAMLLLLTLFILNKVEVSDKKEKRRPDVVFISVLKKVKTDKTVKNYVLYHLFAQLAYYTVIGMAISFLIKGLNFTNEFTFYWRIGCALLASIFGFICLKFTPKNDYVSIFIKYGFRIILYVLVALTGNKIIMLVTITYVLLTSLIFTDVVDGKYVNLFNQKEQLAFANLSYMILSIGKAIGVFICSIAINYNIRINFICAAIFTTLLVVFINKAINSNKVNENDRK